MEMDFMEHRAQFRNNIFVIAIGAFIVTCIWLSLQAKKTHVVWIPAGSKSISHIYGTCFYKKEPFTGYLYESYPDGTLAKLIPYEDGLENGVMRAWYSNRTLQMIRYFNEGKKQGVHKSWWPTGLKRFEYTFKDDEYNGTVKEWYQSGRLCRIFHYNMGHEDGLQQMWWDNGTVRANYVVKNGQQYGLIGRKLCKNTAK